MKNVYVPGITGAAAGLLVAGLVMVASPDERNASEMQGAPAADVVPSEVGEERGMGAPMAPADELKLALEDITSSLTDLREDVGKLQDKFSSLEQRELARGSQSASTPRPEYSPDLAGYAPDPPASARVYDPRVEFEQAQEQVRQRFEAIETDFALEELDVDWSDNVSAQIQDAFSQSEALQGAYLDAMDCRAHRCRLEVEFTDDVNLEAAQARLAYALVDEAPRMAVTYEDDPDLVGRKRAVMYFVRKGHSVLGR